MLTLACYAHYIHRFRLSARFGHESQAAPGLALYYYLDSRLLNFPRLSARNIHYGQLEYLFVEDPLDFTACVNRSCVRLD